MKLLIDNALSPQVAAELRAGGHDAIHVRDLGMASATDDVIFTRAAAEDRIVVSADTDFGTLLALRHETKPSVVLFRGASPKDPLKQSAILLTNLPNLESDLNLGAIAVIEPGRIRVRTLPIMVNP